jgi:hypothetical protein
METKSRRESGAGRSSVRKKRTAQTQTNAPTREKSMRELLLEAGFKVPESVGTDRVVRQTLPRPSLPRQIEGRSGRLGPFS